MGDYPYIGMPLSRDIIVHLITNFCPLEPGPHQSNNIRDAVILLHNELGGIDYNGRVDIVTTFERAFAVCRENGSMSVNPIRGWHTINSYQDRNISITPELRKKIKEKTEQLDIIGRNNDSDKAEIITGEGKSKIYLWTFKKWAEIATENKYEYFPCKLGKTTVQNVLERINSYISQELKFTDMKKEPYRLLIVNKDDNVDQLERAIINVYKSWNRSMNELSQDNRFGNEWFLTNSNELIEILRMLCPNYWYDLTGYPAPDNMGTYLRNFTNNFED